jgi:FtsP/CotA-like multicopper oxidase with cupredoxin domain
LRETAPPGARLRLRLANICNARLIRIRFDGLKAWTIAVSGQPTDRFEPLRAMLPLYPGARYDVIVELPDQAGVEAGVTGMLGAANAPLLTLRTEGESALERRGALPAVAALGDNPLLPAAIKLQGAVRADVLLQGGASPGSNGFAPFSGDPSRVWTVNGVAGGGFSGKPLVSVKRGTTVVLALINRTAVPQVLHLHGHAFRYLHPFDDGWEPYWLDTVLVPEGQTVRIAFLADNPGRWLLGSSVLERLDTGLCAWFQVT